MKSELTKSIHDSILEATTYDEVKNEFTAISLKKVAEILEIYDEQIKALEDHKEKTVGLWAFEGEPKKLLHEFNASQSDANPLEVTEFESLVNAWERFCENKNYYDSPFIKIK